MLIAFNVDGVHGVHGVYGAHGVHGVQGVYGVHTLQTTSQKTANTDLTRSDVFNITITMLIHTSTVNNRFQDGIKLTLGKQVFYPNIIFVK